MNALGASDLEVERTEQHAAARFGCHILGMENELLRGQVHARRDDVEGDEDFEPGLGLVQRLGRFRELAVGQAIGSALRGFGAILLEVEHHLALSRLGAPGLARGVLARLHLALQLHLILHAPQVAFRPVEPTLVGGLLTKHVFTYERASCDSSCVVGSVDDNDNEMCKVDV